MLMSTLDGFEFESSYPELLGKRVLITGIDNEHGIDMARAFADCRTRLVLHARNMTPEIEALGAIVAEGALDVRLYDGSLDDAQSATQLARQAVQAYGGLDVVINIAHLAEPAGGAASSEREVEAAVAKALTAPCLITRIAANRMRVMMTEGLILNIAKPPRRPSRSLSVVGALTRTALSALTRREAQAWEPAGIRVNAIVPATLGLGRSVDGLNGEPDMASLAMHLASARGSTLSGLVYEAHGA